MKKIVRALLLGIVVLCFSLSVKATTYSEKTLIPVDNTATVKTDYFTYQDFSYQSQLDDKGNAKVVFNQIINNTDEKLPVSINLLLFNNERKNIGFLTYCTDKDYDSDYNEFKLDKKQSTAFSITVTSRYFAQRDGKKDKYLASDVKYIAVLDDNEYCKIGGYDNYAGKTLEEIVGTTDAGSSNKIDISSIGGIFVKVLIFAIVVGALVIVYKKVFPIIKAKMNEAPKPKKEDKVKEKPVNLNETLLDDDDKGNEIIDISYKDKEEAEEDITKAVNESEDNLGFNTSDDAFHISDGEMRDMANPYAKRDEEKQDDNQKEKKEEENKKDSNSEGESDLSKFFR